MSLAKSFTRLILVGICAVSVGMVAGCTKKPSNEEVSKLDEARSAAESAEKKLADLKQERMNLEQELQSRQTELQKSEQERDDLQKKAK